MPVAIASALCAPCCAAPPSAAAAPASIRTRKRRKI
jgi:hypothetical protein